MTQIRKSRWTSDANSVHLDIEFSKVNKQKRLVSGWATLDNTDTEGDVVTAEASYDAFKRARGNLREMHKKDSAVGRVVDFKQDTFRAPDGNVYNGIFVTARVSEGAQDTWLKVLDGTLSGFSIGGSIVDSEEEWTKDGNDKIRKVTKYDLTELSLVDNPGNQYADVIRIQKSAGGSVTSITGMVEDQKILNIFFCDDDRISKEAPSDTYTCPVCSKDMNVIGFIEDGSDRDEKVKNLVTKYLSHDDTEGGDNMAKGNLKFTSLLKSAPVEDKEVEGESEATGNEPGDPTEVPAPAATPTTDDAVEEVEETDESDVEEVHDDDEEISKKIDELKGAVTEILTKNRDETTQKIDELEKSIKEMGDSFNKKASELESKLTELDTNLGKSRSRLAGLEKSLEKMNKSAALKKSADLDNDAEQAQNEDPWANSAFSVHGLFR
jgi:phage head maturation protease